MEDGAARVIGTEVAEDSGAQLQRLNGLRRSCGKTFPNTSVLTPVCVASAELIR